MKFLDFTLIKRLLPATLGKNGILAVGYNISVRSRTLSTMQAIRVPEYGGAEQLKLVSDVPIPKVEGNQVLISMKAAGVNPVDTYIRQGIHAVKPPLPYTPGMDGAGTVHAVGNQVTRFKTGDRVFCARSLTGCYAQFSASEEHHVFPLHETVSFSQGAAAGVPYFTAYRALFHVCHVKPGESVLIHGASGAVGLASCQIARACGLTILGTAGTEEGMKLVLDHGAHQVFNHREDGYADKILKATNDEGVDVVIEMLANVNLETDMQLVRRHGRIGLVGSRGTITMTPRASMGKESSIRGVMLILATKEDWLEMGAYVTAGLEKGFLNPVIDKEFPMEKAADAHVEVIDHPTGSKGKIVLSIT